MHRIRTIVTAVALTTSTLAAQVQTPADVNGRWEGTREKSRGRTEQVALVFNVSGTTFTGTFYRDGNEFAKMANGKISGNTVTFTIGDLDVVGTVKDRTMQVQVLADDGALVFTVTRQPAKGRYN